MGRFILLQGAVEQISMLKSKGHNENENNLLDYLENIIGSNRYIILVEKLTKKLVEISEKQDTLSDQVKLIDKEKNSFEKNVSTAKEYLKKEIENLFFDANKKKVHILNLQTNNAKLSISLNQFNNILIRINQNIKIHESELKITTSKYNEMSFENENLKLSLKSLEKELKKYEIMEISEYSEIKELNEMKNKLIENNSKNELEKTMLEKQINVILEDITKLQSAASIMNQQFNVANAKLEKLNIAKKSNTQSLSQKLYQMSEELAFQGSRIYEITRIKKALNEEKKIL